MSIKETLKAVEDKLEQEMLQEKSFTMPVWGWALIVLAATTLAAMVFHG